MDLTKFVAGNDELVEYVAGDVLFRAGDEATSMLIIVDGLVEIRDGDRILRSVGPGDLIGEMALIDNTPRSADAVVVADARVAHIDERRFLFLVQETPNFALHIMSVMAERLRS